MSGYSVAIKNATAYPEELKTRFLEAGKHALWWPYVVYEVVFAAALKVLLDILSGREVA